MLTYGIFAQGFIVLTKRTPHLRTAILACLAMAWPLSVGAQERPTQPNVSRAAPVEADDLLRSWFKEQDKTLDDILLRRHASKPWSGKFTG